MESVARPDTDELKHQAVDAINAGDHWVFAIDSASLPRFNALIMYTGADALKTFLFAHESHGFNLFGIEKSRLSLEELNHVLDKEVRPQSDIIFLSALDDTATDFLPWLTDHETSEQELVN